MRIVLVGINHRTAPVALREQVAITGDALPGALRALRQIYPQTECALISTCNRTELYIARPTDQEPSADQLRQFLATQSGVEQSALEPVSIHREQEPAVRHLFRVAAGLDSMVLGEPQILGQVKRAYEAAAECEAVGSVLHKVFQQAIAAGKAARRETAIGEGNLSVGSAAIDFARQIFEDLSDKTVVSIGIGEMTKTMLRHLLAQSPRRLWLVNRSPEQAKALSEGLGLGPEQGGARPWEEMDRLLVEADIVLTGTGAPEPIVTAARMKPLLRQRRNRPVFVVDLAVPRDVDQDVGTLNNVFLYNLDDLQAAIAQNQDQRQHATRQCEQHIGEAVQSCMAQLQHQDLGQLVRQLRAQLHAVGEQEQQRTTRKLMAQGTGADAEQIDRIVAEHTHRLINKILHMPLSQLNDRDGEAPLGFYAAALRRLFHLEDSPGAVSEENETHSQTPGEAEEARANSEADDAPSHTPAAVDVSGWRSNARENA
jgi:glutamyl-tRNA reductase